MEKGFASWFQDHQIDWQSTEPNPLTATFGLRPRLNLPSLGNMLSPNVTKPEEPCGWFYDCGQGFTSVVNPTTKEQLPAPGTGTGTGTKHEVQKKFLVFDQSNDRTTTLIYSSIPIPYHLPKPQLNLDPKREFSVFENYEGIRCSTPFHDDGDDVGSEMREDTDELRALLYSDDDDDDDDIDDGVDEEEQSTGHSPGLDNHDLPDDIAEEVASTTGPRKRHKLDTGRYDVVSLEDTASSGVNCSGEAKLSSCGNNSGAGDDSGAGNGVPDVESETGKRSRKEKVRETINILQNLIPGGKNGKDAIMILDEAINYLRVLKVKAKALGLDSPL